MACERRIGRWRRPPNWSAPDWSEELRAIASASAWQARCEFDPSLGVPFPAFLYQRVLRASYARYRREWTFFLRFGHSPDGSSPNGPDRHFDRSSSLLGAAVTWLPDRDRLLLRLLFWEGRTEAEVGQTLGVTQSAISRKKRTLLRRLGRELGDLKVFPEISS